MLSFNVWVQWKEYVVLPLTFHQCSIPCKIGVHVLNAKMGTHRPVMVPSKVCVVKPIYMQYFLCKMIKAQSR